MITKEERLILSKASEIIKRELRRDGKVKVPGFGKFYFSIAIVDRGAFYDRKKTDTVVTVRFRAFKALKATTWRGEPTPSTSNPEVCLGVFSFDHVFKSIWSRSGGEE